MRTKAMRTRARMMKNDSAADLLKCSKTIIENIVARNYQGYKVKVNGEWFEINVCACEPPDCDGPITDVVL